MTSALLSLVSNKNLKTACCICKVISGIQKLATVSVKSYNPYSNFVKQVVKIGNTIKDITFGTNCPIDRIIVFFIKSLFLLIISSPYSLKPQPSNLIG